MATLCPIEGNAGGGVGACAAAQRRVAKAMKMKVSDCVCGCTAARGGELSQYDGGGNVLFYGCVGILSKMILTNVMQ